MEKNTKTLLTITGIGAAAIGTYALAKRGRKILKGAKLTFAILGFKIHSFDKNGLKFKVTLRIYNPTKEDASIAVNQVVANYDDAAIAYSTPNLQGDIIKSGASQDVSVTFDIPYLSLVGKGILANTATLKQHLSFNLTLAINGETVTTHQTLSDENTMNGIGQLVSGPRNTRNGAEFNHLIKKSAGKEIIIKSGDVDDVVAACIDIVADHYREVEDLAKKLLGRSLKETCANVFAFAYPYLQYHLDRPGVEELRTPARSWYDGQIRFKQQGVTSAGIDCDDFSIFCGSLLKCLNIPFKFRITKYDGKANFQHIYVVVPALGDSEDEIVIDPVLSKFDYQKPFSFQKSSFDMSPIRLAGLNGFDGFSGLSGLGMPIQMLSGLSGTVEQELMAIASGVDFDDAVNGLGSVDDATLRYLKRTRQFVASNPKAIQNVQNPSQFLEMLDTAILAWDTAQRDVVLARLEQLEQGLIDKGYIKPEMDAIEGLGETNEYEEYSDDLGRLFKRRRKKSRGGFFKRIKSAVKRVGGKVKRVAKKVGKAIVRFNPVTIAMRGGLLAAMRLNVGKIASKLCYAYLPEEKAAQFNIDVVQLRKLKSVHAKVKRMFTGLQGKESNLKKAILKGARKSGSDFSINGNLGVVATAASVTAASGLLVTINKWLKPVKNLFSKKGRTANKAMRNTRKNQYQGTRVNQPESPSSFVQQGQNAIENFVPQVASQQVTVPYRNTVDTESGHGSEAGMSKKTKMMIGGGIAITALGTAIYYATRDNDKPSPKTKAKHSAKANLGRVNLK